MKKVNQTIFGQHGNCFAACLASLLELPIENVPNFHAMGKAAWLPTCRDWLKQFGLFPIIHAMKHNFDYVDEYLIDCGGIHIAGGFTATGNPHSVIHQGRTLIHDPNPSFWILANETEILPSERVNDRIGLTTIEDMTFLVPINFLFQHIPDSYEGWNDNGRCLILFPPT